MVPNLATEKKDACPRPITLTPLSIRNILFIVGSFRGDFSLACRIKRSSPFWEPPLKISTELSAHLIQRIK
jgi:hypothetical protein